MNKERKLSQTREKRNNQICKVFEVKIDESRLNKIQLETLKMFFIEAKWLYNDIIRSNVVFNYDYKTTFYTRTLRKHTKISITQKATYARINKQTKRKSK